MAIYVETLNPKQIVENIKKKIDDNKIDTKADIAAGDFLQYLLENNQYDMLLTANAFAKKRTDADKFIKSLKVAVAKRIKNDPKSHFAKPLLAFYNEIFEYEQQLVTNINLNLFFTNVVCSAVQIIWRNK